MLQTVLEALRQYIGIPDFYVRLAGQTNYTWDYGAMFEYFFAGLLLCLTVSYVFRIILAVFKR